MKKTNKMFYERLKNYLLRREKVDDFCEELYRIEEDTVVLPLNVKGDDYLEVRSNDSRLSLNPEIVEYVEKESYYVPITYPIRVEVKSDLDETARKNFKELYHRHYDREFNDKNLDLSINRIKAFLLLLAGVILLSISFLVSTVYTGKVLTEFLYIAASFLMWECVDYFLFVCGESKVAKLNAAQLAIAEITFVDEQNNPIIDESDEEEIPETEEIVLTIEEEPTENEEITPIIEEESDQEASQPELIADQSSQPITEPEVAKEQNDLTVEESTIFPEQNELAVEKDNENVEEQAQSDDFCAQATDVQPITEEKAISQVDLAAEEDITKDNSDR